MKTLTRKQKFLMEMTAVVLLLVVSAAVMIPRFLRVQSFNTPSNFPDPVFRQLVEQILKVEPGGRFTREDIAAIPNLHLNRIDIQSYKGLEHFTGLKRIVAQSKFATELDLSANVNLVSIACQGRKLEHVQLPRTETVKHINVNMTAVKELDLSGYPNLETVLCIGTRLSVLDLSNNPAVTKVLCRKTPIHTLNLKGLTSLLSLECCDTLIQELDLSTNVNLKEMNCSDTRLKQLDVSQNPALVLLQCNGLDLRELDVSQNPQLQHLEARGCGLKTINITKKPSLTTIDLSNNQLTDIPNLENCRIIAQLNLESNQLDCEDWENLMQQKVKLFFIQFFPQYNVDLSPCMKDVMERTSNEYVQELIRAETEEMENNEP